MASGGKREGAGRKAKDGSSGMVSYAVYLDERTVSRAREIGGGNLSLGIRLLAQNGDYSGAPPAEKKVSKTAAMRAGAPAATQRYVPRAALPEDEKEVLRAAEKRRQALLKRGYREEGGEYVSTENLHMTLNTLRKLKEEFGPAR